MKLLEEKAYEFIKKGEYCKAKKKLEQAIQEHRADLNRCLEFYNDLVETMKAIGLLKKN